MVNFENMKNVLTEIPEVNQSKDKNNRSDYHKWKNNSVQEWPEGNQKYFLIY